MSRQARGDLVAMAVPRLAGVAAWRKGTLKVFRRNPTMAWGIIMVLIMGVVAITAPLLAPKDPMAMNTLNRLQPPSGVNWLGTDQYGRDVFARTIFGSRISLSVGFSVALLATVIGTTIGLIAGYFRKLDTPIMRAIDGIMAIPGILLAIALMALLGASLRNVIVALSVTATPGVTRIIRSVVLSLREQPFVEAGRAVGVPAPRILLRYVLPNTWAPLIIQATYICASAMLIEAALSFLGAGVPPDIPSWGNMIAEGRTYLRDAVWIIVFPGIMLTTTVLGVNLAGDGLRDMLDPKLARRQ